MDPEEYWIILMPLIPIAPLLLIAIIIIVGQRRRRILEQKLETDDRSCVSCGSTDLEHRAGGDIYRCQACGYEGGSGQGKVALDKLRARAQAMSRDERRAEAKNELLEAKELLKHTAASLRAAGNPDLMAHLPNGGWMTERDNNEDTLVTEQANVLRAANSIVNARILLGLSESLNFDLKVEQDNDAARVVQGALINFPGADGDLLDLAKQADELRKQALKLLKSHFEDAA